MNVNRIIKQLRREAKTHPKQATILGGLAVVGIYFWAPLVSGWFSSDEKATAKRAPKKTQPTVAVAAAANPPVQANNAASATRTSIPWREVSATMKADVRMKPAAELARAANPFEVEPEPKHDEPTEAATDEKANGAETAQARPAGARRHRAARKRTPQSMGMKLTATLIGPAGRLAVIDGDVVREGSEVLAGGSAPAGDKNKAAVKKAKGGDDASDAEDDAADDESEKRFQLAEVGADSVILKRGDERFTLEIERPRLEAKDKLEGIVKRRTKTL